jgi:hypothetical protein
MLALTPLFINVLTEFGTARVVKSCSNIEMKQWEINIPALYYNKCFFPSSMQTRKQLMHTGKLVKSHTSTGSSYTVILWIARNLVYERSARRAKIF